MAVILSIETSTKVCSVALARDGQVIAWRESEQGNEHAAKIAVFVSEVLNESGLTCQQLDAVAIGEGPGSYTGLRIGVSTAKGLAYALKIPLIAVSPLQAMANRCLQLLDSRREVEENMLFCPMTDAGRMEVYSAFYNVKNELVREVSADIVDENSYQDFMQESKVVFSGDGSVKCMDILGQNPHACFMPDVKPSARYMAALAEDFFKQGKQVDIAYFEPFYLKDFIAAKPHVKGLD